MEIPMEIETEFVDICDLTHNYPIFNDFFDEIVIYMANPQL